MLSIALILNASLLVGSLLLVMKEGFEWMEGWMLLWSLLLFAAPISSLIGLVSLRSKDGSWLGLYLQRKALEERRRISDLQKP